MPVSSCESPARVVFRYPNFRYYMTARFLITASSEMQSVGVAWQIYGIRHRPLDLGLVGLAQFLPGILLFLISGHAADRIPRQRILQACYAALDRKSTRLNSSHQIISYAVFCLKKKKTKEAVTSTSCCSHGSLASPATLTQLTNRGPRMTRSLRSVHHPH